MSAGIAQAAVVRVEMFSMPIDGPPLMPETLDGLERAIMLLGNRTKAALRRKARDQLTELVGAYPNPAQAGAWKQVLTRRRRDLAADSLDANATTAAERMGTD